MVCHPSDSISVFFQTSHHEGPLRWVCWDKKKPYLVNSVQWVWSLFVFYSQGNLFSLKRNDSIIGWLFALVSNSIISKAHSPNHLTWIAACHGLLCPWNFPKTGLPFPPPPSQPRDWIRVSCVCCTAGPPGKTILHTTWRLYEQTACFQEIKTLQCLPASTTAHIEGQSTTRGPPGVSHPDPLSNRPLHPPCFTAQEFSASIDSTHSFTQ